MNEIIIGKLMKIKKSLNEEFFLSFGDGEVVTVISKYGEGYYLCKGVKGDLQITPTNFLFNAELEGDSNCFIQNILIEEQYQEKKQKEQEEQNSYNEYLEECLIKIAERDAAIKKLKKKMLERYIEIKLLKKELAKYEV